MGRDGLRPAPGPTMQSYHSGFIDVMVLPGSIGSMEILSAPAETIRRRSKQRYELPQAVAEGLHMGKAELMRQWAKSGDGKFS